MLADEVGLGKNIEAGLVLCQNVRNASGICWLFVLPFCVNSGQMS